MREGLEPNEHDVGQKKPIIPQLFSRLREMTEGKEKKVSLEILEFNQEQISLAIKSILEKSAQKWNKMGCVAEVELKLKNLEGNEIDCLLRYLVSDEVDYYFFEDTLAFRFEIFSGEPPKDISKLSFSPFPEDFEDYKTEQLTPIAFRSNYFIDLEHVKPNKKDGIPLTGVSYTSSDFLGLGIGSALLKKVNSTGPIKDFVRRTKRLWDDDYIPDEVDHVTLIVSDGTDQFKANGEKQLGWSSRRIADLGLEPADERYPKVSGHQSFLQKIYF